MHKNGDSKMLMKLTPVFTWYTSVHLCVSVCVCKCIGVCRCVRVFAQPLSGYSLGLQFFGVRISVHKLLVKY